MPRIREARILIMATDGVEQSELTTPRDMLRKAGAKVDVATLDGRAIRGWNHTDWGNGIDGDLKIADAAPAAYAALLLPGGRINPDILRADADAMKVVRAFIDDGKIVAAICHAPVLLVEADAVRGRKVTSCKSIRKDLENAGAEWVDRDVLTDSGIITARSPEGLAAFVAKIIEEVEEGRHRRSQAA